VADHWENGRPDIYRPQKINGQAIGRQTAQTGSFGGMISGQLRAFARRNMEHPRSGMRMVSPFDEHCYCDDGGIELHVEGLA